MLLQVGWGKLAYQAEEWGDQRTVGSNVPESLEGEFEEYWKTDF